MKQRLDQLRTLSRPLEPDLDLRGYWTEKIHADAEHFLQSLSAVPTFRTTEW